MLRGERAEKGRASTRAGTVFNRQSDDGMTSPTADIAGAMAVTRAVGRFLLVQAVLLAASLTLYGWTPYLLWLAALATRSEEHTSELQSLMRISYAVFCLKK